MMDRSRLFAPILAHRRRVCLSRTRYCWRTQKEGIQSEGQGKDLSWKREKVNFALLVKRREKGERVNESAKKQYSPYSLRDRLGSKGSLSERQMSTCRCVTNWEPSMMMNCLQVSTRKSGSPRLRAFCLALVSVMQFAENLSDRQEALLFGHGSTGNMLFRSPSMRVDFILRSYRNFGTVWCKEVWKASCWIPSLNSVSNEAISALVGGNEAIPRMC